MTPLSHFESIWERCEELSAMHAFLAGKLTAALKPDEILRAEWVSRVSALDLYIHEIVSQRMLEIFDGLRPPSAGYLRFQIANDTLIRIRAAPSPTDASQAFDLDVRGRLGFCTYQDPEKIADGIRLVSNIELWNEIALHQGATIANKQTQAKSLKRALSIIVERRNKIAHEGDLQPSLPRTPWPVNTTDLLQVKSVIRNLVTSIEAVL
ncbi:hypothetical protein D3C81_903030 [compost metagenome]